MAILKSENGNELIVSCKCGCEDCFHIKVEHDDKDFAYMTYLNSNWYTDQNKKIWYVIFDKLKKIWAIIRNKDYYYSDIRMTQEDFEKYREYINSIK